MMYASRGGAIEGTRSRNQKHKSRPLTQKSHIDPTIEDDVPDSRFYSYEIIMGFRIFRSVRFCEGRKVSQGQTRTAEPAKGEKIPVFTKVKDFFTDLFSAALPSKSKSEVREPRKRRPKDFDVIEKLGEGSFGMVALTRERASHEMFAMKIVKKESSVSDRAQNEVEGRILRSSDHPFIIGFKCSFETRKRMYFVMEYASGGTLGSALQRVSKSNEFLDHLIFGSVETLSFLSR